MSLNLKNQNKVYHTLRIAIAMCFIGHGAFGIITKQIWLNYFAVFGIGHDAAYKLMPIVGAFDVLMGIVMIIFPLRAIVAWAFLWGFVTASLRPLSGEPVAELIERAGNYGAPFAFLILIGYRKNIKDWFTAVNFTGQPDEKKLSLLWVALKCSVFLILAGHGWLNLIEKKGLLSQYASLGFSHPNTVARIVGIFEIGIAVAVFIKPFAPLLLFLFAWKMTTELFYPNYEIFEWIERGGSYGAILALYFFTSLPVKQNVFTPTNFWGSKTSIQH